MKDLRYQALSELGETVTVLAENLADRWAELSDRQRSKLIRKFPDLAWTVQKLVEQRAQFTKLADQLTADTTGHRPNYHEAGLPDLGDARDHFGQPIRPPEKLKDVWGRELVDEDDVFVPMTDAEHEEYLQRLREESPSPGDEASLAHLKPMDSVVEDYHGKARSS